jgi:hypothetical protein
MDKDAFVHRRKKRYMAQTLDKFEELVEPHLPQEVADEFKGIVRRKFHALALDANEVHGLAPGEELNLEAIRVRDQLHPEGRPTGGLRPR